MVLVPFWILSLIPCKPGPLLAPSLESLVPLVFPPPPIRWPLAPVLPPLSGLPLALLISAALLAALGRQREARLYYTFSVTHIILLVYLYRY